MQRILHKVFKKASRGHAEAQALIKSHRSLRRMYASWKAASSSMFDAPPGLSDLEQMIWDGTMMIATNTQSLYKAPAREASTKAFLEWRKEFDRTIRESWQDMRNNWMVYFDKLRAQE